MIQYLIDEYTSGRSMNNLATEIGESKDTVKNTLKYHGVEIRQWYRNLESGKCGTWYRYKNSEGYISWCAEVGGGKRKYYLEHRLIMWWKIGRELLPDENVHHKNGDKTDNHPDNLELWSSSQPKGQRVQDKLSWAYEIIDLYKNL